MAAAVDLKEGVQYHTIPSFRFTHSAEPRQLTVAYRSLNSGEKKTALIPTCFGGRINETAEAAHFAAHSLAGYHVVVVAMLGNGESSAPSNDPGLPALDYRDCVRAQHALVTDALGWTRLDAVVGFSMAGQQAYYWAAMYPGFVDAAVAVCTSARTSAHTVAFLAGPEAALRASADYAAFEAAGAGAALPRRGLAAFARAWCAWATGAAWFRAGLWKGEGITTMDEWLGQQGETAFLDWHPHDLLAMLAMWKRGDVGVLGADGDYAEVLRRIEAPVLVMPSRTDAYFPPEDSEIEVKHLRHGRLRVIDTIWGHVAGGGMNPPDLDWMDAQIKDFLS